MSWSSSRPRRILAGCATVGALAGSACDLACLEIDCERQGLTISASRYDGDPLAAGEYELRLVGDSAAWTASCTLEALAAGDCAFTLDPSASDEESVELAPVIGVAGDDMPRDIRISWMQAVREDDAWAHTGPSALQLEIRLDSSVLAEESLVPRYSRTEPLGAACGACEHAQVEILLLDPPK